MVRNNMQKCLYISIEAIGILERISTHTQRF